MQPPVTTVRRSLDAASRSRLLPGGPLKSLACLVTGAGHDERRALQPARDLHRDRALAPGGEVQAAQLDDAARDRRGAAAETDALTTCRPAGSDEVRGAELLLAG